jgi:hypothetical protein
LSRAVRDAVVRFLGRSLSSPIQAALIKSVLRRIARARLGALLAFFGVAVASIGMIKYLATIIGVDWAAWMIVGMALTVAGIVVFYSAVPRGR